MFEDDEDGPMSEDDADQRLLAGVSLMFLAIVCAAIYGYYVWKVGINGPAL